MIGVILVGVAVIVAIAVNSINNNNNENRAILARNQQRILDRIDQSDTQIERMLVRAGDYDVLESLKRELKQIKALQYKILPEALMSAEMGKRFYIFQENAERLAMATNEAVCDLLHEEPYSNLISEDCRMIGINSISESLNWKVKDIVKEVEGEE